MSLSPPVHQQRDWRHLQRAAVAAHRALGSMVQKNFRAQFACAASIAVWILQHRPDLAARPSLHVLIAQATEFEALDSGRWLQFIPWLIGRPAMQLRASIVGEPYPAAEEADPTRHLKTHAWALVRDRAAAELVRGSVGDWLEATATAAPRRPDLVVLFSPEFARHHAALLGPDGVLPLVRAGVPLALFSTTEAEQLVDVYTLRAFGLAPLDAECWPNPWALEPVGCEGDAAYAGMGWAGEFATLPDRIDPDATRLVALDEALCYVRDLLDASGDDAFLTLGESMRAAAEAPQSEGASVLLRLPHATAVDSANGHVYQIHQDATAWLLASVPALPAAALASFPGHDDLVVRAMWAVALHREHVQPFVQALDTELRAELAERIAPAIG